MHFASFLAHLRAFYADEAIGAWTRFLDGEAHEPREHEKLRAYLRGTRRAAPLRAGELLGGCRLFVASLAGAFELVSREELGAFGRIHTRSLEKFFAGDSWPRTLAASPRLVPPEADRRLATQVRRDFARQLKLLERAYRAVSRSR
jgi:hypothetical protein